MRIPAVGGFVSRSSVALALSMAALPILVNGQPNALTTVNKQSRKVELKDSVKDVTGDFRKLIEVVFKTGSNGRIQKSLAQVIGLPDETPTKDSGTAIPSKSGITESRACSVVYETVRDSTSKTGRPVCAYIVRFTRSGGTSTSQYYRVNLDGQLEKAVVLRGKRDENGKVIKGSAAKAEQDINSPEVQEAFNTEASFWLKDWLKKQKPPPKTAKKASAATL